MALTGESVVVSARTKTGEDRYGEPIFSWSSTTVDDVLVAPGPRTDLTDAARPDAYRVAWTLHFPKSFTGSLAGAKVAVRGGPALEVVGDPQPYTDANTPGRWNRPVELWGVEG